MKTKIEGDCRLRNDFDYGLDNLFHDRDIYSFAHCSPSKENNVYQYHAFAKHRLSGISIDVYDENLERDNEEILKKIMSEAYEELRYLVHKSPRYLNLVNNKAIIRNRLLGFKEWGENEIR